MSFWISAAADEVWLTYDPPLTPADAAYFLLEPVMSFVLRLRNVLALHASAVDFGGQCVLFVGPAGAGKSTAAAAALMSGASLLSDDLVAVTERTGHWVAHAGTRSIRMWDAGARALVPDVEALPRFSATWDKRTVAPQLFGGVAARAAAPIALVCVLGLRSGGEPVPRLELLTGHAMVGALLPHVAPSYLHESAQQARDLAQLSRLAAQVPVAALVTNADQSRIPAIADVVRRQIRA